MIDLVFYKEFTIGVTLGTVIPSILGFAIYICNLIIKIKQKGWKNLNVTDWKEIAESLEREFSTVASTIKNSSCHCEHCNKECQEIKERMDKIGKQAEQSKTSLLQQANIQVEKNVIQERERKFPNFRPRKN